MYTVFVKYKKLTGIPHPMIDDAWECKAEVIRVNNLLDLNDLFEHLEDVKVLETDSAV